jgi:hypothetical protein
VDTERTTKRKSLRGGLKTRRGNLLYQNFGFDSFDLLILDCFVALRAPRNDDFIAILRFVNRSQQILAMTIQYIPLGKLNYFS